MGRPLYAYELGDPDFSWLLSTYQEQHPNAILVESTCLPVVLLLGTATVHLPSVIPAGLPAPKENDELEEETP